MRFRTFLAFLAIAAAALVWRHYARQPADAADFRVLYGFTTDPYHLTQAAWHAILPRLASASIDPRLAGALALLACALGVAAAAARIVQSDRWIAAAGATLLVATSGFSAPILSSLLGIEPIVELALLLVMALDVLDVVALTPLLRCVLIALAIFQAPSSAAPSAVYAIVCSRRTSGSYLVLPAATWIVALGTRVLYGSAPTGLRLTDQSGEIAAITAAGILFLFAPLAALLVKQLLPRQRATTDRPAFALTIALAMLAVTPFETQKGLAASWIGALSITYLAFTAFARCSQRRVERLASGAITVVLLAFGFAMPHALAIGNAGEAGTGDMGSLRAVLARTGADSFVDACSRLPSQSRFALLGSPPDTFRTFDLTDDAAITLLDSEVGRCVVGPNGRQQIAIFQAGQLSGVHAADIAGALALNAYERASTRLPLQDGGVTPRTTIQLPGHGAFTEATSTPFGTAPTIVAIAGFGYRVRCPVAHPSHLRFAAANPLASDLSASPVRFAVHITTPTKDYVAVERTLSAHRHVTLTPWIYYDVQLPKGTDCSTITFSARAASDRAIAAWVAFLAPTVQ